MPPNAWLRRTAVVLALLAATLPIAARALAGPRGATVHVRWHAGTDDAGRAALEARYRLADGRPIDASTWRYDALDVSQDTLRALVGDPAAADTHNIERSTGVLAPDAPRTGRRLWFAFGETMIARADRAAIGLGLFALLLAVGPPLARSRACRAARRGLAAGVQLIGTRVLAPAAAFLVRGIPEVDARTAGLFRVVFVSGALLYLLLYPVDASWLNVTFDLEIEGPVHEAVMNWLRARPIVVDLVTPWLAVTGLAVIAGVYTRASYVLFVAGVLLWAYVAVSVRSTHPQSMLVLTLVALLPSRWGDGLSVDAWRRRRQGASGALPRGRHYGYSVWIPMLAFGVSFAAAAWAKLTVPASWTSWIANGTVKYHFITDSVNAPVQWGLAFVDYPWLAVIGSFSAIAIEAAVVTAAFVRSDGYRLAMGLGAAGLIVGFWLFMGVAWPGWWVPLLGFLPWQRIGSPISRLMPVPAVDVAAVVGAGFSRPTALAAAQIAFILFVIGQQLVVSALRLERAPMFSWYDMYSGTYTSPEAFNARRPPRFRILAATDAGTVQFGCNPHGEFVRQFEAAVAGQPAAREQIWFALRGCGDLSGVRSVLLEGELHVFDFNRRQFTVLPEPRVIGPLDRPGAEVAPASHARP